MATGPVNFQIIQLKELGLSYTEPIEIIKEQKVEQVEVGINVNYRWNLDNDIFGVQLDVAYLKKIDESHNIELLKFATYTEFKVLDLKQIFKVTNPNDFRMDEPLETTFVSIAISSTRGMLASRTAGTFFGQFIIPLVNPSDLILSKKISAGKKNENPQNESKNIHSKKGKKT
ncbi:MAG: hypothetical protein WCI48_12370 [Bacteroidota bacterium]